eukprot:10604090-Alexandrium_andersonii.AAC.1
MQPGEAPFSHLRQAVCPGFGIIDPRMAKPKQAVWSASPDCMSVARRSPGENAKPQACNLAKRLSVT